MSSRLLLPLALIVTTVAGKDISSSIEQVRSVSREGQGNDAATAAWKEIVAGDTAALVPVLKGMNGANPLASNWLRVAAGALADKSEAAGRPLPVAELAAFLKDTKHDAEPRVIAYDLIRRSSPSEAEKMMFGLLADPSSELRRHPVAKLIEDGQAALAKNDKPGAVTVFQKALAAARDQDQIKTVAKQLRDLGQTVDLPRHFGFLMKWHMIAPFDNTERKGFDTAFPPEKEIDLTASYPGKNTEVKWAAFESKDDYGMIDFNKPFGMEKQVTGYAFTEFNSAADRPAELRLGCKNAWKVWLNGELLFARDEYHRGMKLDQYKLPCQLRKGKNTILVKCCQNEQTETWTVEWQFQLRVCDATGTAILSE